jgi:hypothetical protein
MKASEVVEREKKKKTVSIKIFLVNSFGMYSFWLFVYIYGGIDFLNNLFNRSVAMALIFFLFVLINWAFGQKKMKMWVILFSNCIAFLIFSNKMIRNDSELGLGLRSYSASVIMYLGLFLVFLFAQFSSWIPFLIKFSYANRKNLDDIKWD